MEIFFQREKRKLFCVLFSLGFKLIRFNNVGNSIVDNHFLLFLDEFARFCVRAFCVGNGVQIIAGYGIVNREEEVGETEK